MANLHHGACIALLAACSCAALADAPAGDQSQAQSGTQDSPLESGLSVWLDPRTRRPGSAVDAARPALRVPAGALRDDAKLSYEVIPGVGVLMRTNGQMQMSSWVRLNADGNVEEHCLPDAEAGLATLRGPRP